MMEMLVKSQETQPVSPYPQEVEDFFLKSNFTIRTIPLEISQMQEYDYPNIPVSGAKQYMDYLESEIECWKKYDPENKLDIFTKRSALETARQNFNNALKQWKTNHGNATALIRQSVYFQSGALYSKAELATFLRQYTNRSSAFITGLKIAFYNNKGAEVPKTIDGQEGFYAGLIYREVLREYQNVTEDACSKYQTSVQEAVNNYANLNGAYKTAFIEQERHFSQIVQQTNEHLSSIESEKKEFFDSAQTKLDDLEHLYGEKLKLSEPAEYWKKIDKEYNAKGTGWLVVSAILSVIIIAGLITFLVFVPTIFSEDYHWFDNLKNSAIVTVIASIAIYMLRLTVKMAMSSFHLARDAKERNNLSYFYLALIEKDAVSDKERALVLNSLFSRSDTGLLKGESSPSMPSNIADLVDVLSKKQ